MTSPSASTIGINRIIGGVFGVVYLAVGLLGFAVSGGHEFAGSHGGHLFGIFMVNGLHNIVHILIGVVLLLAASAGERTSAGTNAFVGAVYFLVGILGLFLLDNSINILALNSADNILHLASALLLLIVGIYGLSRTPPVGSHAK